MTIGTPHANSWDGTKALPAALNEFVINKEAWEGVKSPTPEARREARDKPGERSKVKMSERENI